MSVASIFSEKIKNFLETNKKITVTICAILIFMTLSAIIVLCCSKKSHKKQQKTTEKTLILDQKLLIPQGPTVSDEYNTARKTQKQWSQQEIEKWFTTPNEQELQKLSDANNKTISDIIGAAP